MKRHSEGCFFIVLVRVFTFQWLFHGKTDIVTRVMIQDRKEDEEVETRKDSWNTLYIKIT